MKSAFNEWDTNQTYKQKQKKKNVSRESLRLLHSAEDELNRNGGESFKKTL